MKRMPPRRQLAGFRFGLLVVREWVRLPDWPTGKWACVCDCGASHFAKTRHLLNGDVKSCGCATFSLVAKAVRSHGRSKTPMYRVWQSMRDRCERPGSTSYENYGGRGITVCERWRSFENFLADMGERPQGMTLERKDNNGNYEPGNCCWASRIAQARNQRSNRLIEHDGLALCLAAWAERLGLEESFIRRRMDVQGMTFAEAISRPKRYAAWRRSSQAGAERAA